LNRYDEIVLFRPLNEPELEQVVGLMIGDVNKTLSQQNISVELTPEATKKVVRLGYDPRLGARPMRRMIQQTVEDIIAKLILKKEVNPGDNITLHDDDITAR
jgi:ATP-dependent Clp protease ATP-binding subunit ClpB